MTGTRARWRWRCLLALMPGLVLALSLFAQPPPAFNERDAQRQINLQDKDDIWVLDFRFKDPRLITVDIPARGRRVVWYLWYQVINRTDKSRTFIPDFELVTPDTPIWYKLTETSYKALQAEGFPPPVLAKLKKVVDKIYPTEKEYLADLRSTLSADELDRHQGQLVKMATRPGVYHDEVLPKAQEAIRRIEDPTQHLDIKNSVTIASEPIPPSKPDAYPRAITGVATWDEVNPDSNRYSIFVSGLSNGWSEDDNKVIRRKTLQLNFRRVGDRYEMDSREIHFVSSEWIYRATLLPRPGDKEKDKEKEKEKEKDAGDKKDAAMAPRFPFLPMNNATAR